MRKATEHNGAAVSPETVTTFMVLKMISDPIPDDDLKLKKKADLMKSPTESPKKYKGVFFGCVLLCRDKCSKDKDDNVHVWKPCEVTAIDGETAVQLHFVGSPLKYDRWMSLQADWKDLAPTKLLSKDQIEKGTPLSAEQATAVYDYFLTGDFVDVDQSAITLNRSTTPQSQRSGKAKNSDVMPRISTAESKGDSELFVGKKIEVRDIFQTKENEVVREKWRLAQVVEIRAEIVRIHFSGWDEKWDEDINILSERDRIRERRKKAPSLDASLSEALNRSNMLRNCPHCGESLSLAPLVEAPECPSYAGTRRNSMEGADLFGNIGGARRGSSRCIIPPHFEPVGEEDNPTSSSQEESKDEHCVEEPPLESVVPLTVDDRIHIALKVADRRLSSIRSARSLLDVAGDVPTGRRSSVGSLMVPMEMPTGRRSSVGSLGAGGLPIGRSLIGINSKTSFPPPDQFRVSYELPKLAAE